MEYIVLNSYIKLKKQTQKGLKEVIQILGKLNTFLFLLMSISAITSILFIFLPSKHRVIISYICIVVEIICVVIISITTQRERVLNSSEDIKAQDDKYDTVKEWLEKIGFIEKNQIKQLYRRCEIEVEGNNERSLRRKVFIDKIFNLFLIPIFGAVLSWVFDLKADPGDSMAMVIVIGMIGVVLYLSAHGLLNYLTPIIDRQNIKMYKMVKDIQGVLDRKFSIENEDIV